MTAPMMPPSTTCKRLLRSSILFCAPTAHGKRRDLRLNLAAATVARAHPPTPSKPSAPRNPALRSHTAGDDQDHEHNEQQTQSSARVVTPTGAVWPRRQCAQ